MEWLDENAHCIDMIRPGMSTIPNAGLGAFATTLIQKGDLVSTSPVFVIPNRKYLAPSSLLHWTKYCWGRSDSLVLICPSTFAALINHGEKPSGDGVECSAHGTSCRATLANVEYRWSPWNTKANVYLDKSIRDMQAVRCYLSFLVLT